MIYILSLEQPYSRLCYLVSDTNLQVDQLVFKKIMIDYVNMCIVKWHLGLDRGIHLDMFSIYLSKYLSYHEYTIYLNYLDTVYWPYVNSSITEDISYETSVEVTIDDNSNLIITIKNSTFEMTKTPLQIVIENICNEVDEQLYNGEYVHPKLKEIYDARNRTYN